MHPEDIKAAIRKKGSNQSQIARGLGITVMTVSHVINNRGVSARVATRISELIGKPVQQIWPGVYDGSKAKGQS